MSIPDNIRTKPVFKKFTVDDRNKFQPVPATTGAWPYHLQLMQVVKTEVTEKMVFHLVGDTGSAKQPEFQRLVAAEMRTQFEEALTPQDKPLFLYHLGDVVYHFGEGEEYYRQFFEPYKNYPGPVFAIAGNHDSDINPAAKIPYKSLDAFVRVFCDSESRTTPLAQSTGRKTMTQPNVYFTLETPLANIIGLYSNVPKFGIITDDQKNWFIEELKAAAVNRSDKALIVCIHHAPYSADTNHGSSRPMIEFLEDAFDQAGVRPDIVFSGHVHNYQRFSKVYDDGQTVPYIVAGAGGYATLFPVAQPNQSEYPDDSPLLNNVRLEKYCDHMHGFLKIAIEKTPAGLLLTGGYYTIPYTAKTGSSMPLDLFDRFELKLER